MIEKLSVKNFKSVKDLNLSCKQVNVFIGKPNVGKSNILEALSVFSVPFEQLPNQNLKDIIRLRNNKNIFFDNQPALIEIKADDVFSHLYQNSSGGLTIEIGAGDISEYYNFERDGYFFSDDLFVNGSLSSKLQSSARITTGGESRLASANKVQYPYQSSILYYVFKKDTDFRLEKNDLLLPPHGSNLISVIRKDFKFLDEISGLFEEYGLELLVDDKENSFEIQKKINRTVFKYPFSLTADTLQRMIFYMTAVETNQHTTIIFEEPETHSFPPYTRDLAMRIAASETNQFFISTHSPYMLSSLIENLPYDKLNICLTYFKDYQTCVKILSQDETEDLINMSDSAFFNLERFIR